MKVIREIDIDEEIKIVFLSVICRTDKNLEQERMEVNTKLNKYWVRDSFLLKITTS